MQELCRLIRQNIPEVTSINFSNNNISTLATFEYLGDGAKNLMRLSVANNNIQGLDQLKFLKGLKRLKHLVLEPNPGISGLLPEVTMAACKELFPELKKLGNLDCREVISFDLPPETSGGDLPPPKGSHFDSKRTQDLAINFIKKYIQIFDNENRERLDEFYLRETSCFSICAEFKNPTAGNYKNIARNLHEMRDAQLSKTKVGRSIITATLVSLPKMKHEVQGFVADAIHLPCVVPGMNNIFKVSLRGKYWESANSIRNFHRVMLLVWSQNGVYINNDMLFIGGLITKN